MIDSLANLHVTELRSSTVDAPIWLMVNETAEAKFEVFLADILFEHVLCAMVQSCNRLNFQKIGEKKCNVCSAKKERCN